MSNITLKQLKPILPVEVQDKGTGYAFMVIDYGEEHHLMWVVGMDDTGEIWTVANQHVRLQNNWTFGRNVNPPEKVQGGYRPPTSEHGPPPSSGSGVKGQPPPPGYERNRHRL